MDEIKINDIIEVTVTGIQKYGAFVPSGDIYSADIKREMTDFEINNIIGIISKEYKGV